MTKRTYYSFHEGYKHERGARSPVITAMLDERNDGRISIYVGAEQIGMARDKTHVTIHPWNPNDSRPNAHVICDKKILLEYSCNTTTNFVPICGIVFTECYMDNITSIDQVSWFSRPDDMNGEEITKAISITESKCIPTDRKVHKNRSYVLHAVKVKDGIDMMTFATLSPIHRFPIQQGSNYRFVIEERIVKWVTPPRCEGGYNVAVHPNDFTYRVIKEDGSFEDIFNDKFPSLRIEHDNR